MSSEGTRHVFIALILLLPALGAVNSIFHARLLQNYVQQTRRIRDLDGLARFQKMVARQMYAALVQLGLLTTPMVLYAVGILTDKVRIGDIAFVIVPGIFLLFLGYLFKKVETAACRIPALGEDLDEQRLAIIRTWKTRPLPNW